MVVQQVTEAMIAGITDRFIGIGTYHIQAVRIGEPDMESAGALAEQVRSIPGVVGAGVERQGYGLLYSDEGRSGVTIRSVSPDILEKDPAFRQYVRVDDGSFRLTDGDSIVLGIAVAERLNVTAGDEVRLLTARSLGQGRFLPKISRFHVAGIVDSGYRDLDRTWVFVSLSAGHRVMPEESVRELVGVKVTDPHALPNPLFNRGFRRFSSTESAEQMEQIYWEVSDTAGSSWRVTDWYRAEQGRYVSFQTTRNLLTLIMVLVLLVASVSISGSLIMLVMEKEQEIAMLLAVGTQRWVIVRAFVAAGFVVGVVGAALGSAVGLTLSANVNELIGMLDRIAHVFGGAGQLLNADFYLSRIPVRLEVEPLFMSVVTAVGLASFASYVPARRAGRINPESVLRRHN